MSSRSTKVRDTAPGMRGFLFLEAFVRLTIWYSALALTVAFFTWMDAWPDTSLVKANLPTAWKWGQHLSNMIIVYNLIYLGILLLLRLPVPTPKEGDYPLRSVRGLSAQLLCHTWVSILVRARYEAPFPAFLVFHLANLPPLCWLVRWIFGPKSRSCLVLDPPMPDPYLTHIGRNVIVGNMTSIICHTQYRDRVALRKTVIEDDVMIGAHALVYSGCHIKRGAVVYGGAVVPPDTVIGENEAWGGVPAKKIRDLPPLE